MRVVHGAQELPAGRRGLASYADGSLRSVQIRFRPWTIEGETNVEVRLGESPTTEELDLVPVAATLIAEGGEQGPRVWAVLPAKWLSSSGVTGPQRPEADVTGKPPAAWAASSCDYALRHRGLPRAGAAGTNGGGVAFDRGTTMYRGYARRGDRHLESAYRETSLYRDRITGSGMAARNRRAGGAARTSSTTTHRASRSTTC